MTTKAVNLYREPYDVYAGRARRGQPPSKWGNPFIVDKVLTRPQLQRLGDFAERHLDLVGCSITRAEAICLYAPYSTTSSTPVPSLHETSPKTTARPSDASASRNRVTLT